MKGETYFLRRMTKRARKRLPAATIASPTDAAKFPAGLFFARGIRAGAARDISDEITESFDYWHQDSGEHFDMFFPGWYRQGGRIRFNTDRFLAQRKEVERLSRWRYSGETDLVILNFVYDPQSGSGTFAFDEVIVLRVEAMIREKKVGSVAALLNEVHTAARECVRHPVSSPVGQMSDRIGVARGRESLWAGLRKMFLRDLSTVYDNVAPFGVYDLRKSA